MTDSETALAEPPLPVHDDYGVSDGEWLRIGWSEHLKSVSVDSELGTTEVSYVEIGEGPPVFFVHGLGGSWRNWLENIPALHKNHRVVALDLPGFGTSPMPPEPVSIHSYGDLIVAFADKIGLGPETALVGHSMGGFIATEAVIEAPERFSSLTLVAAAGITFANFPQTRKQIAKIAIRMMLPIASGNLERNMGRKRLRSASFKGLIAHPSMIGREILWEMGHYGVRSPGLMQAAWELAGYDTRERLKEITVPTLVVWGNQDRLVPVGAAYGYEKRIPSSELELIDDAGHMVQMERPGRFNRVLEDFVSRKN